MSTPYLNVTPVTAGQNNKEITINDADLALEHATQAVLSVDMSAGDVTLTVDEFTRNGVFILAGATVARDCIVPSDVGAGANTARRVFNVKNTSSFSVTVKVSGQSGVEVSGGYSGVLMLDGTDASSVFLASTVTDNVLDWKSSVRAASTIAATLATSFEDGDTIDAIVLSTGDRILIKDQASGSENGIYVVNAAGAPTRSNDADASVEVTAGMATIVEEGASNGDKLFILTTNGTIVLDTTALAFSALSTGSSLNNNFVATTDPTTDDDLNQTSPGPYGVGSSWVNTTLDSAYVCVDASDGAAVWVQTNAEASAVTTIPFSAKTGDYSLLLADAGKLIRITKASPGILTVPTNASAAFALGSFIQLKSAGAGQISVSPSSGVTLNSPETYKLEKQYSHATIMKVATDTWDLYGDLETGVPPVDSTPVVEAQTLTVQESLTNSMVITVPAGTELGDLLITHIAWGTSGVNTFVTPAGWTELIGNDYANASGVVYYRMADGTEPASYIFTKTSAGNTGGVGEMLRISNARPSVPIPFYDEVGSTFNDVNYPVPLSISGHTNALELAFIAAQGGTITFTSPAGMTEIFDHSNAATSADRASATGASLDLATAGVGAIKSFVAATGTPDRIGITLVVENVTAPAVDIVSGHRYWRFQGCEANGNAEMSAEECEFLLSSVDQTGGGTASSSSGTAANAFDNSSGTIWTATSPWELTYDFGADQVIDEFSWQHGGTAGRGPWSFAIQYSDDNVIWTTAKMFTQNDSWVLSEKRTYTL